MTSTVIVSLNAVSFTSRLVATSNVLKMFRFRTGLVFLLQCSSSSHHSHARTLSPLCVSRFLPALSRSRSGELPRSSLYQCNKMSRSPELKEDPMECPLCMEPLEIDDVNFFPCTCGYQICRFCWHRIRTDENGLCPACRKVQQH